MPAHRTLLALTTALATVGCVALPRASVARAIDDACASSEVDSLRRTMAGVPSFGSVAPPPRCAVSLEEFEELTKLQPTAFTPMAVPAAAGGTANLGAAASVVVAQLLLAAVALQGSIYGGPMATLRSLAWWQLPEVLLATAGGSVLVVALFDRLLLGGAILRLLSGSLRPEAYIRHEAGHTLLALLLGCPVQEVLEDISA